MPQRSLSHLPLPGKKMGAERWEGMSLPGVGMVLSPGRQAPLSFSFTLTLR